MKNTNINLNSSAEFTQEDIDFIDNSLLSPKERFIVKGNVVCLDQNPTQEETLKRWPDTKEEVAYHLAIALDDLDNLAWYKKLARERRSDFLKNCLIKTYESFNKGVIKKTIAAYFTGVVKNRTAELERLEAYKKRTYSHTS